MAARQQQPPQWTQKKRKVRVFTWIILAINVLFLIGLIAAIASSSKHGTDCGTLDQHTCDEANNAGTAIGVIVVVIFWAAIDVILGIIWLVTRRREPTIVYVNQQQPSYQQQPAYNGPPPQQPGGWFNYPGDPPGYLRWWDGQRWTDHVRPQS